MTINWPTDILPYRCSYYLQYNTTIFESPITRTQQVLSRGGPRWMCTVAFKLQRDKAQRMDALLAGLKGAVEIVRVWDFARTFPTGANLDRVGIPAAKFTHGKKFTDGKQFITSDGIARIFAANAGEYVLHSDQWMHDTIALKAGDYIAIDNHTYILTQDAVADPSGNALLYIAPPLVQSVPTGVAFARTYCWVGMRLVDDTQPSRSIQSDAPYEYSLSFVEAM